MQVSTMFRGEAVVTKDSCCRLEATSSVAIALECGALEAWLHGPGPEMCEDCKDYV